ncbi:MAG TPA: aminotransferase class I/II-fold pyridoxal phosphate-dependent enzyme [Bryobacteraceae bacterium]|jgi:aspartate/methionine/tyrosine aminotransferase|nr:aminotransferase class I/II-fold pyridoxal phosphate-dependent enzyme [Bryobacteraceae bacterium]
MASIAEKSLLSPPDIGERRPRFRSQRTLRFTESVIREMTRLAAQHNAVNLAQGFPDFGSPEILRQAACDAINADINQYAITWGSKNLRNAIAAKYKKTYALDLDPEREITVCCGATEGMMATLMAVTNPGDEVVIFEPYYENYGPDTLLAGADRKFVKMHAPDWRFDREELRRAFSPRTKAIILCSPNNPTGRVFDRSELEYIAELCQEFDALAITDEIYEHILYDGTEHVPIMTIPGMRNRTVLINSMSKTYAVTGWRIGWVLAAPDLADSIRKIHDFLTVGSAAPLQEASAVALGLPDQYYTNLARDYRERRDTMLKVLEETGFRSFTPRGAYYILCDISGFGYADDMAFCRHLVEDVGIAAVPGSSFFENPRDGSQLVRFCFCKKYETLKMAQERLRKI